MRDLCIINVYAMGKNKMDKKFLLICKIPCAVFGKVRCMDNVLYAGVMFLQAAGQAVSLQKRRTSDVQAERSNTITKGKNL